MTDTPLPQSFTEAQQLMLDEFAALLSKDTMTNAVLTASQKDVAKQFGVHPTTVGNIILGKQWRGIA